MSWDYVRLGLFLERVISCGFVDYSALLGCWCSFPSCSVRIRWCWFTVSELAMPPRLSQVHWSLLWRPSFLFSDGWDCLSYSLVSAVPLSVFCSTGFVVIAFAFRTILLFLPQFDNSDGHSSLIAVYLHEISLLFYAFWTCSVADERPDCYFGISAFVNELKSLRLPCSFSFSCLCFGHLDYDMFQRDSSPAMPPCGSNCFLCFGVPFFL